MKPFKNAGVRKLSWSASVVLLAVLTACANPVGGGNAPAPGEGSETGRGAAGVVTIAIGAFAPQSIIPEVSSLVSSYEVTLSRSGYESLTDSGPSGPFSFSGLAVGTWDVTVVALDGSANAVGTGVATVEASASASGNTTVAIAPTANGSGTLSVSIDSSAAPGMIAGVQHATLTPDGQSPGPSIHGAFSVSGDTASYTNASILSGQYTLVVRLADAGNTHVATVVEAVHVYDNVETAGTITLSSGDISQAPAAPAIISAAETASGSGNVSIDWSDNSNVEERYLVAYSSDGGSSYSSPIDLSANATSYTFSGLDPETTYTLRVTGENSFGSTEDTVAVTTGSISVYHVSASTGNDTNNGRQDAPLATITEALSQASSGDEIRVETGTYNEHVLIEKPVSIYGSYAAGFGSRSIDPPTSVIVAGGNTSTSVRFAESGTTIDNTSVFDGFDVRVGGTRTSSFTEAITISEGAPTISNSRLTGWNGISQFGAGMGIGSSRGASALIENSRIVGSVDGPWTQTIRPYGNAEPIFKDNTIIGVEDGGSGGGSDYAYALRATGSGKVTLIGNYISAGTTGSDYDDHYGISLEGGTDADLFGNVITTGKANGTGVDMFPLRIGQNGNDTDNDGVDDEPLNVRAYGNTIHTGFSGRYRTAVKVDQTTGNLEFANNLIVVTPGSGTARWFNIENTDSRPNRLENNAISGPGNYIVSGMTALTTVTELNTAGTATASAGDVAAGNIIATPSFTDPTNGDFTLDGDTSSAIGEGGLDLSGTSSMPTTDLGGTARTAPWTIGAYEYDGPFASGSAEASITFDNPEDPDVSFSGTTDGDSITKGTDLSLTAPTGYTSYVWYLNGTEAPTTGISATGNSATVTTGDLALGTHSVAVVVGDGTNLYSAQVDFTVVQ